MAETESIPTDVLLPGVPRLLLVGLAFLALATLIGKALQMFGRAAWIALRLVQAWRHKFVFGGDAIQKVSSRRTVARHYLRDAVWYLWGSDRYAGRPFRCEHPPGCDVLTWCLTRNSSGDATMHKWVCLKHRCAASPGCGQMAVGTIEPYTHYQQPLLVCWDHINHGDEMEIMYFTPFAVFEEDWQQMDPETKRPLPLGLRLNNPGLLLSPPEKPAADSPGLA